MKPSVKSILLKHPLYVRFGILILYLAVGPINHAIAQTDMAIRQFQAQPSLFNPAFTGAEGMGSGTLGFTNQWSSLSNRPVGVQLSYSDVWKEVNENNKKHYNGSIGKFRKGLRSMLLHGTWHTETNLIKDNAGEMEKRALKSQGQAKPFLALGGLIWSQFAGPLQRTIIKAGLALNRPLSSELNLAYGAQIGFSLWQLNNAGLVLEDQSDKAFTNGQSYTPELSIGAALMHTYYYAGISFNQLVSTKPSFDNGAFAQALPRYISLNAAWQPKTTREFSPRYACLINLNNLYQAQYRVQITGHFKDKFSAGMGIGNAGALQFLTGFRFNKRFLFNYCYERHLTDAPFLFGNTHEITLAFRSKFTVNRLFQ